MMRRLVTVGLVLALGRAFGDGEKAEPIAHVGGSNQEVSREYLLAHGFKRSARHPRTFVASGIRLGKAMRDLGICPSDIYPFPIEAPKFEVHAAIRYGSYVIYISSEMKDAAGRGVPGGLQDPNSLCTVSVVLDCAAPDAQAVVRIRSVAVTDPDTRRLQVTFLLMAVGKTPLAFSQRQFSVFLSGGPLSDEVYGADVKFAKNTPTVITVSSGKPVVLTMSVAGVLSDLKERVALASLAAGEYRVGVAVSNNPKKVREFDYESLDEWKSDYRLIRLQ